MKLLGKEVAAGAVWVEKVGGGGVEVQAFLVKAGIGRRHSLPFAWGM